MKQKKKHLIAMLLALLILGTLVLPATATPPELIEIPELPDETQDHVVDVAGALSTGARNDINNLGIVMWDEIRAEIIVVAVDYITEGMYTDEMMRELFDRWEVSPRGMLLLFSTQEKRGGLLVGREITGSWPVSRIDAYLENYFYDDLDAGNFDTAVLSLVRALTLWYEDYYQVDLISEADTQAEQEAPAQVQEENTALSTFWSLLPILIIILLAVIVISSLAGRRRGGDGGGPGAPMMGRRRGFGGLSWFFMGSMFGRRMGGRNRWGAAPPPGGGTNTRPPTGGRPNSGSFGSGTFRPPGTGSRGTFGGSRGGFGGSRGGGFRGGGRGGGFGGRR